MGMYIDGIGHVPYSLFNRLRRAIAQCINVDLSTMEGYGGSRAWSEIAYRSGEPDPIVAFLYHSDCDGTWTPIECLTIAIRLETVLPQLIENERLVASTTLQTLARRFIDGFRHAASANRLLEIE